MSRVLVLFLLLANHALSAQSSCESKLNPHGSWKTRKTGWQHPNPLEGGPMIEAPTAVIPGKKTTEPSPEEAQQAAVDFWVGGFKNFFDNATPERRMRSFKKLQDAIVLDNRKDLIRSEIFPVEILARETATPFKNGFRIEDLGFYRALAVLTRKTTFGFYSRTYEHTFGRGLPQDFAETVAAQKDRSNKYINAENAIVNSGKKRQLEILKRLLIFTFPHYGRRDWHIDEKTGETLPLDEVSLDKMITDVFDNLDHYLKLEKSGEKLPLLVGWTVKALQSFPQTTYHEIFKILPDGKEQTVAMVGVTKASYGIVKLFNLKTNRWEEHYGPFGSKFGEDYFTKPWDDFAPPYYVSGHDPDGPLFNEEYKPIRDAFSHTPLWSGRGVPLLPMEVFLNRILPRGGIPDALYNSALPDPRKFSKPYLLGPLPDGVDPDFSKPVIQYTGQILEPTKFAINKDFDERTDSYSQLHLLLMQTLFSRTSFKDFDASDFILHGQKLYTYNPGEINPKTGRITGEVSLYLKMGWRVVPEIQPVKVNGITWIAIGISPEDLMNYGPNKISNVMAKTALLQMMENTNRYLWKSNLRK